MKNMITAQTIRRNENRESWRFAQWVFLLFLGLKLSGHIQWDWFWVTSPLWIQLWINALCHIAFKVFDIDDYLLRKEKERVKKMIEDVMDAEGIDGNVVVEDDDDNDKDGERS